MAIQDIKTYNYKNIFSLKTILFENSCVTNTKKQLDTYDIFWIKEGKGNYSIDFKNYSFDGNVILFLSPKQVFSIKSEKVKEAYQLSFIKDFYCIQTHDAEIACNGVLFNNIYENPFIFPSEKESEKLNFIISLLTEEFKLADTAKYDMLQSYLKQFIIQSVRLKKETYKTINDTETKLFKDFSVLVELNFKKLHSVTDYANRLGISPKSLTKHLQKLGAETPSEFIKNRIITEAKRQLLYSNQAVKEIAFDLGFNDPAYFSRFFTKAAGISPLKFKKNYN